MENYHFSTDIENIGERQSLSYHGIKLMSDKVNLEAVYQAKSWETKCLFLKTDLVSCQRGLLWKFLLTKGVDIVIPGKEKKYLLGILMECTAKRKAKDVQLLCAPGSDLFFERHSY